MIVRPEQHATTSEILKGLPNTTTFKGKLIVFTSFYDYRGHAPHIQSLVALAMTLERLGVKWDYWPVFGDFSVDRAINEAYTRFMEDEEATDILNIDSDESFEPMGVLRLLAHQEEIVGGAYLMKNNWSEWTANWMVDTATGKPVGRVLNDGTALIRAARLPWGFLRIKKTALQKYAEAFPDLHYTNERGKEITIFCESQYRPNPPHARQLFTQDSVLSERLREIGIDIWLDPNITIGHWGNREHRGNLHQHLLELNKRQADHKTVVESLKLEPHEAQAFADVQAMAQELKLRAA